MDDDRATQIAGFLGPEAAKDIAKFQAARAKMTDEEKAEEVDDVRKQLVMLMRKKKKPEGPYEVDKTEEADMTKQADAPAPEDTIEIGDNNDNDKWAHGQEKDDNNTLHPRTGRKQVCENYPEESLFSKDSNDDHDDNDPDDNYSQSADDENKKKKSKRKTPTSTIWTPRKTHWSGRTSPAAREAANVMVVIGAKHNISKSW